MPLQLHASAAASNTLDAVAQELAIPCPVAALAEVVGECRGIQEVPTVSSPAPATSFLPPDTAAIVAAARKKRVRPPPTATGHGQSLLPLPPATAAAAAATPAAVQPLRSHTHGRQVSAHTQAPARASISFADTYVSLITTLPTCFLWCAPSFCVQLRQFPHAFRVSLWLHILLVSQFMLPLLPLLPLQRWSLFERGR